LKSTHLDENGAAIMVDISQKAATERVAIASGLLKMRPETLKMIREGSAKKGDVLAVARVAGIMAAKRCSDLIPLCHPLPLTHAKVDFDYLSEDLLKITSEVKTTHNTGVEMEALTAVTIAALTVYDMCKGVDRSIEIQQVYLEKKSGGQSGEFNRESDSAN